MKKRIKVSSGDKDGVDPYTIAECYIEVASKRLQSPYLGPKYKALLEKQIEDCRREMEKKAK